MCRNWFAVAIVSSMIIGIGGTQRSGLCMCGVGASGAYSYTVTHSLNSFVLADC